MLALAALLASAALAPSQLLARHAPIVVLHPHERFAPTVVEPFLAATVEDAGRLEVPACDQRLGPGAIACYEPLQGTPTVYGRVLKTRRRTVLQYWLFYPYNMWPSLGVWRSHEGDWEHVTIVLDARQRPIEAGYSAHCLGHRRAWARVRKRGVRPLVYVGLGSHANYFAPGAHRHDLRCYPPEMKIVFDARKVVPVDLATVGRELRPRLARPGPWLSSAVPWGGDGWFFIEGVGPLRFGQGPLGPAFQSDWRDPLRELGRWPLG
jgi:hypothetical protein